jgi:PEP-CTERM motif
MNTQRHASSLAAASAAVIVCMAGGQVASASLPAFDIASNAAYDDGWQSGDNGGVGFGPWDLQAIDVNMDMVTNASFFIGDSTTNGEGDIIGDGDINTSGEAFGMSAHSGDAAIAIRPFTGVTPLLPIQRFSIEMDNGLVNSDGAVGFALVTDTANTSAVALNFSVQGNLPNYRVTDGDGINRDTGFPITTGGLRVDVQLSEFDGSKYELFINGTPVISGALIDTSGIVGVGLANVRAGEGLSRTVFFNSIRVTPEPASMLLLAIASAAIVYCRWRR